MSDESNYAENAIWRMVGARITSFGANANGEICLTTDRGDEFVIGKDEAGEVSLFEIERKTVAA